MGSASTTISATIARGAEVYALSRELFEIANTAKYVGVDGWEDVYQRNYLLADAVEAVEDLLANGSRLRGGTQIRDAVRLLRTVFETDPPAYVSIDHTTRVQALLDRVQLAEMAR